jgi:hypothetical protein
MNERWRIACHEAGHVVAGVMLGGRVTGALIIATGGQALVDGLYSDRFAFMIAAGPLSESLASSHEPPVCESVVNPEQLASTSVAGVERDLAIASCFADLEAIPRSALSDDRHLAEWAITGREDQPQSWARRVEFCHHVAGQIVDKNAGAIVRIAEQLFIRGRLSGQEITNLISEK